MISQQSATLLDFQIYFVSEEALSIQFGSEINEETFHRIKCFSQRLIDKPFAGFKISIPAYTTLTIFYSPIAVIQSDLPGNSCFERVSAYLHQLNAENTEVGDIVGKMIEIPVCYGGEYGPDLDMLSTHCKLSCDEVIKIHSNAYYKVHMIGFVPGFAYMGGMDERLIMPRKTAPRALVPAGSIGVAGEQTGIYALSTPGGWQILGRSPLTFLNLKNPQPSLLRAGDQVMFKPISTRAFDDFLKINYAD